MSGAQFLSYPILVTEQMLRYSALYMNNPFLTNQKNNSRLPRHRYPHDLYDG